MLKNRASISKKGSIIGGCGNGEERCDGVRVLGFVGFEEVGMNLLQLVYGFAFLGEVNKSVVFNGSLNHYKWLNIGRLNQLKWLKIGRDP